MRVRSEVCSNASVLRNRQINRENDRDVRANQNKQIKIESGSVRHSIPVSLKQLYNFSAIEKTVFVEEKSYRSVRTQVDDNGMI